MTLQTEQASPTFHWKKVQYNVGPHCWKLFAGHVQIGSVCRALSGGEYHGSLRMSDTTVRAGTEDGCREELERVAGVWFSGALMDASASRQASNAKAQPADQTAKPTTPCVAGSADATC